MPAQPPSKQRYVTHEEFTQFAVATNTQLSQLRDSLTRFSEDLSRKIDDQRPRASMWFAAFGMMLTTLGMGAALASFALDGAVQPIESRLSENEHELDILWDHQFKQLEWNGRTEVLVDRIGEEQARRTGRVYAGDDS
jgi:hypothetical protein